MTRLTEDVAAGGGLVTVRNQVSDRCESYLPPGPQVSLGLSLSSVSADNVLHTTTSFNTPHNHEHITPWLLG